MYRIKYRYLNPHGAGPFRGSQIVDRRYAKGEEYYAMFGRAIVVSCGKVKQA